MHFRKHSNLAFSFVLLTAFSAVACTAPTESPSDETGSAEGELQASASVLVGDSTITTPAGADVVRRVPGETVTLKNVSGHNVRLLLAGTNVLDGKTAYAAATKLDLPAEASVVLGTAARPLRRGVTFVGLDDPSRADSWFEFAKLSIWVGRRVTRTCDLTTASLGSDDCPAWGVDQDFCTCTPAFGGGG